MRTWHARHIRAGIALVDRSPLATYTWLHLGGRPSALMMRAYFATVYRRSDPGWHARLHRTGDPR